MPLLAPISVAESVGVGAAAAPVDVVGEAAASAAAARSGRSVRVADQTSETEEVVANPDGTFTLTQSLRPVRVRVADEWVPVDLTLARRADGSVGPVAAPVELRLSGGGGSLVVVLGENGREVGLTWPGTLPRPTLAGPSATYAEVLPGVDLVVTADIGGFTQVLVVKNREAARSPALRTITFGNHTKGTTVTGGADGLVVRDSGGQVVFTGDASDMWDSAGSAERRAVTGPAEGAQRASMGVVVTAQTVAVTPDKEFLDDPGTVFPVFLDPSYITHDGKSHHVMVQSGPYHDAHNYDRTDGDLGDLKAGYICDGPCFISRSYIEMATAGVRGKFIHSATLRATVLKSFACAGAGPTQLWWSGPIGLATTWDSQPGRLHPDPLSINNRTNNPSFCPSDGGADFDATLPVRHGAANGWLSVTLMLSGQNEANHDYWRRFNLNPVLEVVYNSYPNQPDQQATLSGTRTFPCVTGASRPYVSDRQPVLRARFSDPDRSLVNGRFYWGPVGQPATGSAGRNGIPTGSFEQVQVASGAFVDGGVYAWRAQAGDDQLLSPFSAFCEVAIDVTPPGVPAVSSPDYPENSNTGFAGEPGRFTFAANGTPDVVKYVYTTDGTTPTVLGSPAVNAAALGGSATITITAGEALNRLWVRSVDRADNMGPVRKYEFSANGLRSAVASWPLDRQFGDLTYRGTGTPSWSTGYVADAFRANPATQDHLTASTAVDTRKNFSVSAWVKLDTSIGFATAVSQDGSQGSGFVLQYHDTADRWAFGAANTETDTTVAVSAKPPAWHEWTHLVGSYDAHTKKLRLYVNGVLEGEESFTVTSTTPGPLVVGAGKRGGQRVDYFTGSIDAVQVWDRVVGPLESGRMNNAAIPRAHYKLDEGTGTTTRDEVTGQGATIEGDTAWTSDEFVFTRLSGNTGGLISAARPAVRTGQSFTVSAWVRLATTDGSKRTALSFTDPRYSPFLLGYDGTTRKWQFFTVNSAQSASWSVHSTNVAVANTWVHLTGVYDSVNQQIHLYVDGQLVATETGVAVWGGTGSMRIGGGTWNEQTLPGWKGDIDDVRVHSGVRDQAGVKADMDDRAARS